MPRRGNDRRARERVDDGGRETRQRMVVSTALLMRERGAKATSFDTVIEHSGAPRGSIYHHFPGGRAELLREATDYAGGWLARRLERHGAGDGDPLAALDWLVQHYSEVLVASDFRAGCPVVAVAVESPQDGPDLRPAVAAVFARWTDTIAEACLKAGIAAERAHALAELAIAALEGAVILSRAQRDVRPLQRVGRQLREQVRTELEAR
jgi:AcrR family transcriptional regulator